MVRARQCVAQSGLSRAGRAGWCRRWLWRLRVAARVTQAAQGCGRDDSGKDWGGEEMV